MLSNSEKENDTNRIIQVMGLYGYQLSTSEAYKVWSEVSSKAGFSWGPLPVKDRELVSAIIVSSDIDFTE